jgi:ABC-type dipeptide/oligopeptide/nickel transport system permease subunit
MYIFPGFAIILTMVFNNFIGEGLHDTLNPKEREV